MPAPREMLEGLDVSGTALEGGTAHLLNPDGTFNVARTGLPLRQRLQIYQGILSMSWTSFTLLLVAGYLAANTTFAIAFLLCGPGAIVGGSATTLAGRFGEAFNLSVHTITTLGYGNLVPGGVAANIIVTVEAFFGLGSFAIVAGLIVARFARPTAAIQFSDVAIMDTEGPTPAFRFRVVNCGRNELIDVRVRALVAITRTHGGVRTRQFRALELDQDRVAFFPMDWVLSHTVSEGSPLNGLTPDSLMEGALEVLVLVHAIDDATSQTVHARSSYRPADVHWNVRFADMLARRADGQLAVDLRKLNDVEAPSRRQRRTRWMF